MAEGPPNTQGTLGAVKRPLFIRLAALHRTWRIFGSMSALSTVLDIRKITRSVPPEPKRVLETAMALRQLEISFRQPA